MQARAWMTMAKIMTILEDGQARPTEDFLHLMPTKKGDQEWSQRTRTVGMLLFLGRMLDVFHSRWKLVQLADRGHSGLYQLQKRDIFELPPTNRVDHASKRTSSSQAQSEGQ